VELLASNFQVSIPNPRTLRRKLLDRGLARLRREVV